MAKGEKPYDQAAVDAALGVLDNTARKLPTSLFPENTGGMKAEGDYSTSSKVWDDKADFDAKVAGFTKAVNDAKGKIKDPASLKAVTGAIAKECGSCHETFRLKV